MLRGRRTPLTTSATPVNSIPTISTGEYMLRLDNSDLESFVDPPVLRRRPRGVENLRRYWGRVAAHWPLRNGVSSAWPLYLYYKTLLMAGQRAIAFELVHFLRFVVSRWNRYSRRHGYDGQNAELYVDDFVRHYLKQLSAMSYMRGFTESPGWIMLTHVHALTGKAPFTVDQIKSDIESWVSDSIGGRIKKLDMEHFRATLHKITGTWYHGEPDGHLGFGEYCNDYMRWGTNGGAPRVDLFGSRYRTKWAWAIKHATDENGHLLETYDLYGEAIRTTNIAHVALKEEPQKTRAIITTPLPSYMRQCYLMYRWGKPRLPSPISSGDWLPTFEATSALWYGCIDGEKFDHTIPRDVIIEVIDALGGLDEETRLVADAEIEHLKTLELEWAGSHWSWRGGLLSGWRFTSLIGTLVSVAAAEYIISTAGGGFKYGVMGDDIVIYSQVSRMTPEQLVDSYVSFGLNANLNKTVSGRVGEFLRKVRSMLGSWGYPALGLRSVVYSQPWISNYTYENEVELTTSWLTYYSRLIPFATQQQRLRSFIYALIENNLKTQFGTGVRWMDWLLTPISAGGGGCLENTDYDRWSKLVTLRPFNQFTDDQKIPLLLGVLKTKRVVARNPLLIDLDHRVIGETEAKMVATLAQAPHSFVRHHVNKTKLIYGIMFGKIRPTTINQFLTYPLPYSLRITSRSRIIEYLLTGADKYSGITSITHTKEAAAKLSHGFNYLVHSYIQSRSNANVRNLPVAVTMHAIRHLSVVQLPFGTW